MSYLTELRGAVCIAAIVAGGAAQADVTATQVWDDWKDMFSLYGEDGVSFASEDISGDTLTVSDLQLSMSDDTSSFNANIGDITFVENGNGTVSITMAESYPIVITDEKGAVVTVNVTQSDLELTVSGDPDDMNYAVSADRYAMELVDVVDGDVTFTGDVQIVGNDLTGEYTTSGGDIRNITYALSVASLDMLADIEMPGADGEYFTGSGKIAGMTLNADMAVPSDADFENPETLFVNGFTLDGGYTVDSANYIFDFNADGDQAAGAISTGEGQLDASVNNEAVSYDVESNDIAINVTSGTIPFPIELGLAQYGVGFEMPVGQTEEPADFGLSFDFIDLTLNDMIWSLFDGGNVLPRDPATIQFDLSGTAKPLFDLFDPEQAEAIENADMPGELNSLTLNNLKVEAAGASVTGTGDFVFDNTDTETFDGFPRPEGEVNINLNGINGLMDNLIAMGLLPEDQAMGGRMMMGMFARTVGDDELATKLEINAEGHVIANGQRIQ